MWVFRKFQKVLGICNYYMKLCEEDEKIFRVALNKEKHNELTKDKLNLLNFAKPIQIDFISYTTINNIGDKNNFSTLICHCLVKKI